MADSAAVIGEVINGRYEVTERIGEGALFQAFKARDRTQNRMVALKLLRSSIAATPGCRDRVVKGGSAAIDLVHPNIIRIYAAEITDRSAFLATEYVHGMTLKERVRRTAPVPLAVTVDIAIAIADALAFAHSQGVVHGDLRSHNVLITGEGQVKVADFGMGAILGPPDANPSLRAIPYLSPEVAEGHPPTPASDLYSLGVVLYEMTTGILPFEGDTAIAVALKLAKDQPVLPSRVNAGVPPALDGVILKCLQKDPARRYRSIQALLKDLHAVQDSLRYGRSLNWSPAERSPRPSAVEETEIEEIPASAVAISTLNRVLVAVVLLGLGTVAILAYALLFRSVPDVRVPDLIGQSRSAAMTEIEPLRLVPHFISEWSEKVPADQIYRIYPAAGTAVKAGSDLSVWVSKGPEMVAVPDVTQVKTSDALKSLRDGGLKLGNVTEEYNDNLGKGVVISQTPEAGKLVPPGTAVDLVKSMGSEPVEESPPPVPDTSAAPPIVPPPPAPDATAPTPAPDTGAGANAGTTPPDTTPPAAANPTATTPAPARAPVGPRRRFDVHVDVPSGRDPQQIRIEVIDDTGSHIRYHGSHHPFDSFDRIVSGRGDPVTLRVYSDGNVIFEESRPRSESQP